MDRISNLPDEILCHIGSFLSAKEAAFTKVLSKRWQNLFTIIPYLHFDCTDDDEEIFTDFLDRLLALPASSRVRKCFLNCCWMRLDDNIDHAIKDDHINRCIRDLLKRGVLDLTLWANGKEGYSLPFELFTCETITKLSLGYHFAIDNLPENACLPALKTLKLDYVKFFNFGRNCTFKMLLAACPVLEELKICGVNWELWKWSRTVSSLSIKRLFIIREEWSDFDGSDFSSISFDVPNLVYLYYFDQVPKNYINVNLNSLVGAKLHLCPGGDNPWEEGDETRFHPMNLFHGLRNIENLKIDDYETLEMFNVFRESLPVFEKLSHLSVKLSLPHFCRVGLQILIKKSPNLKILTINGPLHYYRGFFVGPVVCECLSEYSFLLSCPLEILNITAYNGHPEELIQMELILEKLSCLELVKVHTRATGERKLKLIADLEKLPRASSKCEVHVV